MPFGEVVCGSPGSGKSTYCYGKHQLFNALNRPISIINLDPANENIPYPCDIDISSLITLKDTMDTYGLGPNGGMLFCMEYLDANFDWLEERLKELGPDAYVLFDLPGQVELSTSHESVKNIVNKLTKIGFRVSTWSNKTLRIILLRSDNSSRPYIFAMRITLRMPQNTSLCYFCRSGRCSILSFRISMSYPR
jgi:GTPase SAR1 family protein